MLPSRPLLVSGKMVWLREVKTGLQRSLKLTRNDDLWLCHPSSLPIFCGQASFSVIEKLRITARYSHYLTTGPSVNLPIRSTNFPSPDIAFAVLVIEETAIEVSFEKHKEKARANAPING